MAAKVDIQPLNFEATNLADNWKKWRQTIELLFSGPLASKDEAEKFSYFLLYVGQDGRDIYNTWTLSQAEEGKVKTLLDRFQAHCVPRQNVTINRYRFYTRNQGPQESIEQYLTELRTLAKDCSFGLISEEMIRDKIVCGTNSKQVQERLLQEPDLDLMKALTIARGLEASKSQMKEINSDASVLHVSHRKSDHKHSKSFAPKGRQQNNGRHNSQSTSCPKCGKQHWKSSKCPAEGVECYNCHNKNHFSAMCRSKPSQRPPPRNNYRQDRRQRHTDAKVHAVDAEDGEEFFIGTVNNTVDLDSDDRDRTEVFVDIKINGKHTISMKLDTGAQVNILSISDYETFANSLGPLEKANSKLSAYGGKWLEVPGTIVLKCEYGGITGTLKFFVVRDVGPSVLSLRSCEDMKLIKVLLSVEADKTLTSCHSSHAEEIVGEYKHLFKGLGHMDDEYVIRVDDSVTPVVHASRKLPLAIQEKVKTELERMESLQVIHKVDEPTEWVNSMVVVTKPSGDIRLCLDPSDLNRAVRREHYKMPTIEDVTSKVAGHKYFTVLDAKSSYWQVPLDHGSSLLTTFNTPFGRYRFLRLPFGIKSASEVFQKRMDRAFEGLTNTHPLVDDILVSGRTIKEHNDNLRQTLETASIKGIRLNAEKLQLCQTEVKFFGELLTSEGMRPDPDKVEAVRQMKTPTGKKELEGYLGMFTYLAQYAPALSEKTHTLRELTKKESQWDWTPNHDQAFTEIKELITKSPGPVLQYFDVKKDVILQVDASQNGVGAVLLQENGPVAFASKAMTDSQRNYAQIEKEMMAIVFGCEKFHHYLFGRSFVVVSDHKPLETIFKKPLHAVPLRLQRMRIRLQMYDMTVRYTPGKDIPVADILSRHFEESDKLSNLNSLDDDVQSYVHMITSNLPISSEKMSEIRSATSEDASLQAVARYVHGGWPSSVKDCVQNTREFWTFHDELSYIDGILFKGNKVIIPSVLRSEMLEKIHTGHMGMQKCKDRARDILYWSKMSDNIERMVEKCSVCQQHRTAPCKEPMIPTDAPSLPWDVVATDLFYFQGHDYLLVVDYYSRYIEIALLTNTKAITVITHLKSIFARHGIPSQVVSDNGPQYSSKEFMDFAKLWDFKHVTSSPLYPQANGLAEKSVQTVKRMLLKAKESHGDPYLSLLAYRNTPVCNLGSPAQLLMSRRLQTNLPCHKDLLRPKSINPDMVHKTISEARMYQKRYYDRNAKSREPLQQDDNVRVKMANEWVPAIITRKADTPRSYYLRTSSGGEYRRNRRDINSTKESYMSSHGTPVSLTKTETDSTPGLATQQSPKKPVVPTPLPCSPAREPSGYTSSGRAVFKPQRFDN